ncbi:MAG: hypothetical protein HC820_00350, partial [Hydrococcus sp. RM1_1_31]|nr:hypothetical protein [Hydrococcus sp. RM1_1_31]
IQPRHGDRGDYTITLKATDILNESDEYASLSRSNLPMKHPSFVTSAIKLPLSVLLWNLP